MMLRRRSEALKHVVTFRITNDEKELLEDLLTSYGGSVSALMRDLLQKISKTSFGHR